MTDSKLWGKIASREGAVSLVLTAVIVLSVVAISSTAGAVDVSITDPPSSVTKGDTVSVDTSITIKNGERIPVDRIEVQILKDGTVVDTGDITEMVQHGDSSYKSGSRVGYGPSGYGYTFGTGPGYGYSGSGQVNLIPPSTTVNWDTSGLTAGETYQIRVVVVSSGGGNAHNFTSEAKSFTVQAASTGGTGGSSTGDRSSGSTSGTTATSTGSAKTKVSTSGRQVSVNIENAQAGDTVTVQRAAKQVTDEVKRHGSTLESIETSFTGATNFDMKITASTGKPDPSIPDPPSDRGAVGYINVEHSASDDAIGEVAFNFRVAQQRLDDAGLGNDEVVLYRYSGGEWTALETEFVGTADDGTPRFRAVSPGLSAFAIGGPQAQQGTPTDGPADTTTDEPPATDEPTTTAPPATTPGGEGGDGGSMTWIFVIIVVLTFLVGGVYWYGQQ